MTKWFCCAFVVSAMVLFVSTTVQATPILIDFASSGSAGLKDGPSSNSPGHEDGGITETNWTTVTGDATIGGLTFDLGLELDATPKTINFANPVIKGVASGSGLFANSPQIDSLVRDSGPDVGIAVAIAGLDAGTYTYYMTSNFEGGSDHPNNKYLLHVATGSSAIDDFTSSIADATWANTERNTSWKPGINYGTGDFTLGSNQVVTFFVDAEDSPTNSAEAVGFLNTLTIVPESSSVPEPTTLALTALALLGLAFHGWRRKR